jgi:hypothetical protein
MRMIVIWRGEIVGSTQGAACDVGNNQISILPLSELNYVPPENMNHWVNANALTSVED